MNNAEVVQFVELEIASRYRTLDDTVRGDWVRAVWKAGEIETARQIIREIVDDPETTLNVKNFYRRLKSRRTPTAGRETLAPAYDPYVRCLEAPRDHPTWENRQWFVMGGVEGGDLEPFRRAEAGNKQHVADWAQMAARHFQSVYGGQWCGVVREAVNDPDDNPTSPGQRKANAERQILDGPDTPGRRWLKRHQGQSGVTALAAGLKTVPPTEKPNVVATKDMIDRLKAPPVITSEPLKADADFFDRERALLAAEEQVVTPAPSGATVGHDSGQVELPIWAQPVDGAGPEDEF